MNNIGLIVTSDCDLPAAMLENNQVTVLAMATSNTDESSTFDRSIPKLRQFYEDQDTTQIDITDLSAGRFFDLICNNLIYQYDQLVIISPDKSYSASLQTIRKTLHYKLDELNQRRILANLNKPLKIRVVESRQVLTGYGLCLYEALRLQQKQSYNADQVKQHLDQFKQTIQTYILPGHNQPQDLNFSLQLGWLTQVRLNLSNKYPILSLHTGTANVNQLIAANGRHPLFFDFVNEQINNANLTNRIVNISFAGSLAQLKNLKGFDEFHAKIKEKGGKLIHSMMVQSAAIKFGRGTLSVSFSATSCNTYSNEASF